MRLLELHSNGSGGPVLEFHPNVTVVRGLSPDARRRVIHAVAALPTADDPEMGGLVEAHGVMFDLTQESLGLLGLNTDLDVLIRREDLPAATNGSDPRADTGTEPAASAPGGAGGDQASALAGLERARVGVEGAREAFDVMSEALERAKLERAAAAEARQRVSAALDKVRRERDLARERVDAGPAADVDEQQTRERIERLTASRDELAETVSLLEERDPRPIEVLLEALRGPESEQMVPSKEALELADEFSALQTQLDGLERDLQADGLSMDQLSQTLEDSRFELAQSEKGVERPNLGPDDVRELEDAHEEVLQAGTKAGGRIGRKAALKRLDEAREAEQGILDRVGFPTWTAYIMGSSLLNIDPVAEQRLEKARTSLNEAEDNWEALTQQLEANPDYAGLLDRLESVYLASYDILGGKTEGDLEQLLRAHMVPDEDVSHVDIIDALVYQLDLRGADVTEGSSEDAVTAIADTWLTEAADHWEKHRTAQEEHQRIDAELAGAERDLEDLASEAAQDTPEIRQRSYEEAGARVAEVLHDLEAVQVIEDELEGQVQARDVLMGPSRRAMEAATGALGRAEATAKAGGVDPVAVGVDGDSLDSYFVTRFSALRGVSYAGSVPLVIDDALVGIDAGDVRSVLGTLERVADTVQLIYLSDDAAIAQWADSLGIERAATVDAPSEFSS